MQALAICVVALVFGFVGSMPIAGPISVMVVSRAARRLFKEALRISLGAAVAEAMYAAIAFWGFATLLARHPIVLPISHGVTAIVLAALGVRFVFWRAKDKGEGRENAAGSTLRGFSISAINPTLLVTWGAAVAFIYSKGLRPSSSLYALPFGACAGAGVAIWFTLLVKVLRKYDSKVARRRLSLLVRILGVALVLLGVWSAVQLVQWFHHG